MKTIIFLISALFVNHSFSEIISFQNGEVIEASQINHNFNELDNQNKRDQFPLVETAWGIAMGKTYYRKCWINETERSSNFSLTNFISGHTGVIGAGKAYSEYHKILVFVSPSEAWRIWVNAQGTINFGKAGSVQNLQVGANFCLDYWKD